MPEHAAARSKSICILGMHRSGTSALSRVVNLLGAYLGEPKDIMQPAPDNPEGFWERDDIVVVHDRLLIALNQRWDSPLPLKEGWQHTDAVSPFRQQLAQIIADALGGHPLWAWKDPRTCILFPLWQDLIAEAGAELSVAHIVRNPVDIANSLSRRNGFPVEKSYGIWLNYSLSALRHLAGVPLVLVNYDDLLDDPANQMRRLSRELSIPWPANEERIMAEIGAFLRQDLRHSRSTADVLNGAPKLVSELYRLLVLAVEGRVAIDSSFFDHVTAMAINYEESAEIFRWDMNSFFYDENLLLPQAQRQLAEKDGQLAEKDGQLAEKDRQLAEKQRRIEAFLNSLSWRATKPIRVIADLLRGA